MSVIVAQSIYKMSVTRNLIGCSLSSFVVVVVVWSVSLIIITTPEAKECEREKVVCVGPKGDSKVLYYL